MFGSFGAAKPAEKEGEKKDEAPKGGFSFGAAAAKPAEAPAASTTGGGLFGAKPAEPAKAPEAKTTAPASNLFGGAATSTSTAAPATTTAPATGQASKDAPKASAATEPAPNLLRGKTLEDVVDNWTKELDGSVKEFVRQAGEVREWDKVLVRTGSQVSFCIREVITAERQITDLYRKVIEAQQSQSAADKALDYIDNQQKELEGVIAHYENQVAGFTSDSSRSMPGRIPADKEREKM